MFDFFHLRTLYCLLSIFGAFALELLLIDDEPFWEPVEWSVFSSWFLFYSAWTWFLAVYLSSRYGSYSPQDRVVWEGLYKVNIFFEFFLFFYMLFITIFVTLPFYYEVTYSVSNIVLWWSVYNMRIFLKVGLLFSVSYKILHFLRTQLRWFGTFRLLFFLLILFIIMSVLLFFLFINFILAPISDIYSYIRRGWMGLEQLTQGPCKWGSGPSSRDHFSYHKSSTIFWFKNDPLLSGSLFFFCLLFYLYVFFLYMQVFFLLCSLAISRRASFNNLSVLICSFRKFGIFIYLFWLFFVVAFIYNIIRLPINFTQYSRLWLCLSYFMKIFTDLWTSSHFIYFYSTIFFYVLLFFFFTRYLIKVRFYFLLFLSLVWSFLYTLILLNEDFFEFFEFFIYPELEKIYNLLVIFFSYLSDD